MRKYIPAGILLLLYLPVIAQEEGRGTRKEFNTAEHVIQVSPTIKSFSIQLPVNAQLQESLEGRLLYLTTVKKSTLHGLWQSWYGNGQTCDSGRLVRNIPDGEWIIRNRAGQLMAVRTFNADGYHRVLEEIKRPNPKRNFYHLGQIAIQNRNLALHFLQAEYSFPDKRKDAQFHSVRELVLANSTGQSYRPVFENGLLDGLYMNYFDNGQVKDSGQYQKGIREGYWIHRESPSSETRSGTYRHGLKDQEWKIYSPDGRLQEIILYRKGTLRWQKQFRH
jgi:antitoxin component YwqK of YwqJK toxin-antitoxin module